MTTERSMTDHWFEQFLSEDKLMGSRCTGCGVLFVPPRAVCIKCRCTAMEWVEMNGSGRLAAFTCIAIGPPSMAREGYGRDNPYCSGVVELEEGSRVVARIEGVDTKHPEAIKIGMPLQVTYLHRKAGDSSATVLAFLPS